MLWSGDGALDRQMLAYTVGDDRVWDTRLLGWDILGSLGHAEGLRHAGIIRGAEHTPRRSPLRPALRAAEAGRLRIGPRDEDVHSAVELWITRREPGAGERLHTGRSRNDQVAADIRLYLKDSVLSLHAAGLAPAAELAGFAARHRRVLWPRYTPQRRAVPSSAGPSAAAS